MKIAAEIFADRNYEDDGNLVSRSKNNAIITATALRGYTSIPKE
jgi:lactam utilization protein B